jgi:hypothetical protein
MGEISGVLAKLEQVIERIEAIETRLDQPDVQIRSERSQAAIDGPTSPGDVSTEFQRLRATVQSVRLPPELYLSESKQGIKKEDLPTVNVLAKVARFAETGMKLMRDEKK